MKKYLSLLCAALLCACCLALAACGGSSGASTAASGSAASAAADPTEKFIGDWKFAAMEYQGMTMTGDLNAILDTDEAMTFSLKEDGTSSMVINGDAAEATWELKDENTITFMTTEAEETRTFDVA